MAKKTRQAAAEPAARSPSAGAARQLERWQVDAGDATLANLHIPPDARRQRRFEIACAMTVRLGADAAAGAWHAMAVQLDGAQQWSRRIATSNPGSWDGLDYRFACSVPPGRALRLVVQTQVHGAQRRSLVIEADEIA